MSESNQPHFSLSTGTDLAFALVVFMSYFSAFSTTLFSSFFLIIVIVCLGVAYVSVGIYGFSFARRTDSKWITLAYFVVQFLIGGLIIHYGRGAGFTALILLPVVAHTVMLLEQNWMLMANIGIAITYFGSVLSYSNNLLEVWQGFPVFFVALVFILIFTQMAVTEQKARQNLEEVAHELSEANMHLSEYAGKVHDLAIAQERNRFAREIHDGLGHYLTTINMQISAATAIALTDPVNSIHMLEKAKKMTSEALVDVRNSVFALRKDGFEITNLVASIRKLVEEVQSNQWEIRFEVKGIPRELSPQASLTLYRAAQETLNNAQKHSHASFIQMTLDYSDLVTIEYIIEDNGDGTDNFDQGFGLIGIGERVKLLKGDLEIESSSGKGFLVNIKFPG